MLGMLFMLVALAQLVVFVMVLIRLFQTEGALKGILGIICGLYTFIWGWINATKLGIKNLMLIWTALLVLMIVLQVVTGASMMTGLSGM
jgi:hypothetical protein